MIDYNPKNWFWFVAGDESQAWSSSAKAYVPVDEVPEGITPTRIPNEVELYDALARVGQSGRAPSRTFTAAEVRAALIAMDSEATGDASTPAELMAVAEEIQINLPPMAA